MKNRAKCKKCTDIIESFHSTDLCYCSCGTIAVDGGQAMKCLADDWKYFVRVDDEGNEIVVSVHEKSEIVKPLYNDTKPKKKELLDMIQAQIESIERLPQHAMTSPCTQSDLASSLMLILAIFRSDCDES